MMQLRNLSSYTKTSFSIVKNTLGIRSPIHLIIRANTKCNMKCKFCDMHMRKITEITTNEYKKIISDSAKLGTSMCNFTGGEPLIRNDIASLVRHAKKTGHITMMNTNGYYPSKIHLLKNNLDHIYISLDFPNSKLHDTFRGTKNSFNKAIESINISQKNKIDTRISCTVMTENMNYIEDMVLLAKKLNVKISLHPVIITSKLLESKKEAIKYKLDFKTYAEIILRLKKKYKNTILTSTFFINSILKKNFTCKATNTVINVLPNGKVLLPCELISRDTYDGKNLKTGYYSKKVIKISKQNGQYKNCKNCYSQCQLTASLLMNPKNSIQLLWDWV